MFKEWLQNMFPQTFLPLQDHDFAEDPATPPPMERRRIKAFDNSPALTYHELVANLNVSPDAICGTTPEREARRLWEEAEFAGYVPAFPAQLVPQTGDPFFLQGDPIGSRLHTDRLPAGAAGGAAEAAPEAHQPGPSRPAAGNLVRHGARLALTLLPRRRSRGGCGGIP